MRTLKPWTHLSHCLHPMLATLRAAMPVLPAVSVSSWVRGVTFEELILVDTMCRTLGSAPGSHPGAPFEDLRVARQTAEAEAQRERWALQYALRLQFGLDVCLRRIGLRKTVQWTGVLARDAERLLCKCWYDNGLFWASTFRPGR